MAQTPTTGTTHRSGGGHGQQHNGAQRNEDAIRRGTQQEEEHGKKRNRARRGTRKKEADVADEARKARNRTGPPGEDWKKKTAGFNWSTKRTKNTESHGTGTAGGNRGASKKDDDLGSHATGIKVEHQKTAKFVYYILGCLQLAKARCVGCCLEASGRLRVLVV